MAEGKFVTLVNCMDGRTQLPGIEFMKEKYGADYVDTITEPGPIKIMAEKQAGAESIKARAQISVEKHGSKVIGVVSHYDCGGNPVGKETQLRQLADSIAMIKSWDMGFEEIIGLWIGEDWKAEQVA